MLTYSASNPSSPENLPFREQIQIALAIADSPTLQSLLTDCTPPITLPHRMGGIRSSIGIPITEKKSVDGMIHFEELHCVLIDSPQELEQCVSHYTDRHGNQRGYLDLTRCEAETRDLGLMTNLAQAIAQLSQSGLSSQQIQTLLHLPQDTWHKTWWYMADQEGNFTVPFLRLMRCQYYMDGRIAVQYKDLFAHDKPPCFKSREQTIIVEIFSEAKGFKKTLEKINYARQQLGAERALLIGDRFSELEIKGFTSQGISLYAAQPLILPAIANCAFCVSDCPLRGRQDSPVLTCQQFCVEGT